MRTVLNRKNSVNGKRIARLTCFDFNGITLGIYNFNRRSQFTLLGPGTPINDDLLRYAGRFVDHVLQADTLDKINVANSSVNFGQNWERVRVPLRNLFAALNLLSVFDH